MNDYKDKRTRFDIDLSKLFEVVDSDSVDSAAVEQYLEKRQKTKEYNRKYWQEHGAEIQKKRRERGYFKKRQEAYKKYYHEHHDEELAKRRKYYAAANARRRERYAEIKDELNARRRERRRALKEQKKLEMEQLAMSNQTNLTDTAIVSESQANKNKIVGSK